MEVSTRFIAALLEGCLPVRFYLLTRRCGRQMVLLGSELRGDAVLLPSHRANRRGCVPGVAWTALGSLREAEDAGRSGLECAARGGAVSVQRSGTGARTQSRRADGI